MEKAEQRKSDVFLWLEETLNGLVEVFFLEPKPAEPNPQTIPFADRVVCKGARHQG
jgi:hypothetical protein